MFWFISVLFFYELLVMLFKKNFFVFIVVFLCCVFSFNVSVNVLYELMGVIIKMGEKMLYFVKESNIILLVMVINGKSDGFVLLFIVGIYGDEFLFMYVL